MRAVPPADAAVSVVQQIVEVHSNVLKLKEASETVTEIWGKREALKKSGQVELHDESMMPVAAMAQIVLAGAWHNTHILFRLHPAVLCFLPARLWIYRSACNWFVECADDDPKHGSIS
jgi:hypothetical protein